MTDIKKSIISTDLKCFLCGRTTNLHIHHFIHGNANRAKADEHGLYAYLCINHHDQVHKHSPELDLQLKVIAQTAFERKHGHDEFMKVFGRSWIEEKGGGE